MKKVILSLSIALASVAMVSCGEKGDKDAGEKAPKEEVSEEEKAAIIENENAAAELEAGNDMIDEKAEELDAALEDLNDL